MTTYTRTEFATIVLRDLGLISAEETASAEDSDWVRDKIESSFSELVSKGLRFWDTSDEAIKDEFVNSLSKYVAAEIAPSYGLGTPGEAVAAKRALENDLRRVASQQPTFVVAQADYF